MSEQAQRSIQLSEIAALLQRGGPFQAESRYGRDPDANFVPWGRSSFKPAPPPKPLTPKRNPDAGSSTDAQQEPTAPPQETKQDDAETAARTDTPAASSTPATASAQNNRAPPAPPPTPTESAPSPDDIIAAIERAKEDGRALGYQQGVEATRKELSATLSNLRKLEGQLTTLTSDAVQRNADIIAHHVRRIAQDLFGAVFAEIPGVFIERIKTAAEMFTKAGGEFTLAMNPHDLLTLSDLLRENEIFEKIRIVEDDNLQPGAFHLSSRDLDYEDAPMLSDMRS
jgi:flagellar biosynthesis/type III secretory pathway protein FliH